MCSDRFSVYKLDDFHPEISFIFRLLNARGSITSLKILLGVLMMQCSLHLRPMPQI